MNITKMLVLSLIGLGTMLNAGGDFSTVTAYESDDALLAEEAYQKEYVEEYDEEIYVEPSEVAYVDTVSTESISQSGIAEAVNVSPVSVSNSGTIGSSASTTITKEKIPTIGIKRKPKSGFYAGLGISALDYDIKCACPNRSDSDQSVGVMTRVGYNVNNFIGVEARGITTKLKNGMGTVKHAGLYLKPMIPITPSTNAYTLIGVAKTKTSGNIRRINASALSLGGGVEMEIANGIGAFVDYERLIVKSGAPKLDTLNTGVSYGF